MDEAGAVTTIIPTPPARRPRAAHQTRGRPERETRALGSSQPRREPEPAAVRTAQDSLFDGIFFDFDASLSQDGVEALGGCGLFDVARQGQLGGEDSAGLRQHALLARG